MKVRVKGVPAGWSLKVHLEEQVGKTGKEEENYIEIEYEGRK